MSPQHEAVFESRRLPNNFKALEKAAVSQPIDRRPDLWAIGHVRIVIENDIASRDHEPLVKQEIRPHILALMAPVDMQ